jgi:hypothetical protein
MVMPFTASSLRDKTRILPQCGRCGGARMRHPTLQGFGRGAVRHFLKRTIFEAYHIAMKC